MNGIEQLHDLIRGWSSWRSALIAFAVTITLFVIYNNYVQPLRDMLGDQVYLDIRVGGYSYEEAVAFFDFLGEEGRALYLRTTVFDTVWPLGVALTGLLFAPLAFRRAWPVLLGALFPVAFGTFDLLENVGLFMMLSAYPDISPALVAYTNVMTVTKQAAIPIAFAAFFGLPFVACVLYFRRRR